MHINAQFDSGNIEVVSVHPHGTADLRIRKDAGGLHMQWFYFRVDGAVGVDYTLRILNAGDASYPNGWLNYRVCTSSDRRTWTRLDTDFSDGVLTIEYKAQSALQWFAYFAPYTYDQHLDFLAHCQLSPLVTVDRLGATLDDRDLHRLRVGEGPLQFWLIGRQHPGESMASWWMDGFLKRLLDPQDQASKRLRQSSRLHIVPNMNPDGAVRGHLRCNAAGANLNREWAQPSLDRSPEVYHTRSAMDGTGVDFCLDVHGDEALPYNFLSGPEGIPGFEESRLPKLCDVFAAAYMQANSDLQKEFGYPITQPGKANMTLCTTAVAARFKCPAYTLEMPFKDNANAPDPIHGWSPARCGALGASAVDALDALATYIDSHPRS